MRIGLDLDGVLADLISETLSIYRLSYRKTVIKSEVTSWDYFLKRRGISTAEQSDLFNRAWNHSSPRLEEECIPQVLKALKLLGHSITILTHRHKDTHASVFRWISTNQLPYDNLLFLSNKEDKMDYPIDVLVDDHPKTAEKAINHPSKTLLLKSQPWNRNTKITLPNVRRIESLEELLEVVNHV